MDFTRALNVDKERFDVMTSAAAAELDNKHMPALDQCAGFITRSKWPFTVDGDLISLFIKDQLFACTEPISISSPKKSFSERTRVRRCM